METSDSGQTAGIARVVRDAPRGDKKVNLQSSRALSARGHVLENGRLGVATSGGPLGRRTGIVLELEQGKLPWLESFFSSLKTERTARKMYRTRDDAKADVFDYIERFYNPKRRHSTIGYLSPMEFERQAGLA